MDHPHNVQICAGCLAEDLRVILRRLLDLNTTTSATAESLWIEAKLTHLQEVIYDAQASLTTYWPTQEAGLGENTGFGDTQ